MINHKMKLTTQLYALIGLIFILMLIALGLFLPNVVIPAAENNLYTYLREPLIISNDNSIPNIIEEEVAHIYKRKNEIAYTDNLNSIIKIKNIKDIFKYLTKDYGIFIHNHKTYYYYQVTTGSVTKIAITNNKYINETKESILNGIFPLVISMCLIIGLILTIWARYVIRKIEKLKTKIDNIDNEVYNHNIDFYIDDELKQLSLAIEDMRLSLISQEEYRSQMYQNISHDFKTPLTVIKSYIEAYDDKIESEDKVFKVVKEQTNNLEEKVYSLLYLNKLDYLKNDKNIKIKKININKIITKEVEKFKFYKKEINFIVNISSNTKFYGTEEHWETILDNLLSNFMRYTKSTIKITVKNNKIILFNDGDNIEEKLLAGIFTPFRKGINGQFGLGLSIVKKSLNLMNYDIEIKNEKKGVSFIISKNINN